MMKHTHVQAGTASPEGDPILDLDGFRMLASVLGPDGMTRMAATFFEDAERRLGLLDRDAATPADLQDHAHALISMAGHLGLRQLSTMCMDLQEQARRNAGLEGRPALRHAVGEARRAVQIAVAGGALRDAMGGIGAARFGPALAGGGREWTGGGGQAASG